MWVWLSLAALAAALAALALMPVVVRARLRLTGTRLDVRFELRACFGLLRWRHELPRVTRHALRRFAVPRRMAARGRGARRAPLGRRPSLWVRWFSSFPRALVERLAGRVVVRRLRLDGSLGTGDAARTAVAFGGAWALLGGLLGASHAYVRYAARPDLTVVPDFGRRHVRLDADCILAARQADIIIAVASALLGGQLRLRGRSLDNPRLNR